MNIPTIIPAKTRRHHRQKQSTSPPPVGPLTLLVAQVVGVQEDALIVSLVFDTTEEDPLAETLPDATQWTATFDDVAYVGHSLEFAAFDTLQLLMLPGGTIGESGRINYAAAPSDIADVDGRMLGAVVDMELSQE